MGGRSGGRREDQHGPGDRVSKIFEARPGPPDTPFTALELGDVLDRSRSFWSAPVLEQGEFPHVCFSFLLPQLMTVMYMD